MLQWSLSSSLLLGCLWCLQYQSWNLQVEPTELKPTGSSQVLQIVTQTQVFAFPSTCQFPPSSAVPLFFLPTCCVLQWPCLPSLSSPLLPLLCSIKCSTSASLTDRGCSSFAGGDREGKEEKEKLLVTKEAAETLKDELSSRSGSQSPFVRAANLRYSL